MISRKSLLLFVLFLGFLPLFAHAAQEYTVVKGDNLWTIAKKYKLKVKELRTLNKLTGSDLHIGQKLIVSLPGTGKVTVKKGKSPKGISKSESAEENVTSENSSEGQEYTVVKGDTLGSIAKRHGINVKELRVLNNLTGSALKIGQKLVISSPGVETPEVTKIPIPADSNEGKKSRDSRLKHAGITSGTRTKKVQQKAYWADVLSKKVTEYAEGILESEKSENPAAVGTQVLTGDQVKQVSPVVQVPPGSQVSAGNETPDLDDRVPAPVSTPQEYTVRKGDNLWSIAKRHGITVKELRAWNKLAGNSLKIGQELIVSTTEREESHSTEIGSNYRTEKVYHKIKNGDTLAKIARKYGTGVPELKRLNKLSGTRISAGKRLLVKVSKVRVPSAEEPALEVANNKPSEEEPELPPDLDGVTAKLLQSAFEFVGVPYRLGGFSQLGIDCSGLVKKAFSAIGIDLPRTARTQFLKGEPVAFSDLLPGDLLFFTTKKARYPTHVAIWLGKGLILHASRSNRRVVVDRFEESGYFRRHFIGARRVLSEPDVISPVEAGIEVK